jgi:hypothetical protein
MQEGASAFPALAPPVASDSTLFWGRNSSGHGFTACARKSKKSLVGRGFRRDVSLRQSIGLQPLKSYPRHFFRTLSSRSAKIRSVPKLLSPASLRRGFQPVVPLPRHHHAEYRSDPLPINHLARRPAGFFQPPLKVRHLDLVIDAHVCDGHLHNVWPLRNTSDPIVPPQRRETLSNGLVQ